MALSHSVMFDALRAAGPGRADALRRMETVAHVLDTAFRIPGTQQRIGIDALIGIIPGLGDAATTLLSSYIIWEARQLGVPRHVIARMLGNLAVHGVVGSIPVVGDVFDAFFRVNRRNMRIVQGHLERERRRDAIDADYRVVGSSR